jgi:hypothetical protein
MTLILRPFDKPDVLRLLEILTGPHGRPMPTQEALDMEADALFRAEASLSAEADECDCPQCRSDAGGAVFLLDEDGCVLDVVEPGRDLGQAIADTFGGPRINPDDFEGEQILETLDDLIDQLEAEQEAQELREAQALPWPKAFRYSLADLEGYKLVPGTISRWERPMTRAEADAWARVNGYLWDDDLDLWYDPKKGVDIGGWMTPGDLALPLHADPRANWQTIGYTDELRRKRLEAFSDAAGEALRHKTAEERGRHRQFYEEHKRLQAEAQSDHQPLPTLRNGDTITVTLKTDGDETRPIGAFERVLAQADEITRFRANAQAESDRKFSRDWQDRRYVSCSHWGMFPRW